MTGQPFQALFLDISLLAGSSDFSPPLSGWSAHLLPWLILVYLPYLRECWNCGTSPRCFGSSQWISSNRLVNEIPSFCLIILLCLSGRVYCRLVTSPQPWFPLLLLWCLISIFPRSWVSGMVFGTSLFLRKSLGMQALYIRVIIIFHSRNATCSLIYSGSRSQLSAVPSALGLPLTLVHKLLFYPSCILFLLFFLFLLGGPGYVFHVWGRMDMPHKIHVTKIVIFMQRKINFWWMNSGDTSRNCVPLWGPHVSYPLSRIPPHVSHLVTCFT